MKKIFGIKELCVGKLYSHYLGETIPQIDYFIVLEEAAKFSEEPLFIGADWYELKVLLNGKIVNYIFGLTDKFIEI